MGNRTFSGRSKIAIARSGNGVNKKDYFLTVILTFAFSMMGPVSEAQAQANLPTGRASAAELARLPDDIDWQEIARGRAFTDRRLLPLTVPHAWGSSPRIVELFGPPAHPY
jgi:hypothetical protein